MVSFSLYIHVTAIYYSKWPKNLRILSFCPKSTVFIETFVSFKLTKDKINEDDAIFVMI
jgi:hypothetical protein